MERLLACFICIVCFVACKAGLVDPMRVGEPQTGQKDRGQSSTTRVELDALKILRIDETPRDVAVSYTGKWIFVLTDRGEIDIYSGDGVLVDTVSVDPGTDRLKVSPGEDKLYLLNSAKKTVEIFSLDFIQSINISGFPWKGAENAPVAIVVFSDFQCGYCARLARVLNQVVERHPQKVKIAFKNFPLKSHNFAHQAAVAALAAQKQGKFWEFHDLAFKNFDRLDEQKIRELSQQLGLDRSEFEKDLKDPEIEAMISRDLSEGVQAGVRGTPTVFVNGKMARYRSLEEFQGIMEKELEKVKKET